MLGATSANANCATFMLGARAAGLIKGGPMLAPLNLPLCRG